MENKIRNIVQTGVERMEQDMRQFDRDFDEVDQRIKEQQQAMRERQFRLIRQR